MGNNVLKIANKELRDLLDNEIVLVIVGVYILLIMASLYDLYTYFRVAVPDDVLSTLLVNIMTIVCLYGSFLGVIIGFFSISSELHGNALNTLLVKPVYRDTIINGKVLGEVLFIVCTVGFGVAFYTFGVCIVFGDLVESILPRLLVNLPLVMAICVVYTLVFLSLSMLISLLVRNRALALILSVLTIVLSDIMTGAVFVEYLSIIIGGSADSFSGILSGISPWSILDHISINAPIFSQYLSATDNIQIALSSLLKLIFYVFIAIVFSYIAFLRRDVS